MKIEVKDIKKSFGKKTVLDGVSFSAESGECIGILGGNGSGKSTLFSILAGILKSGGGTFTSDGADLFRASGKASPLGYVPQSPPLIEELSARDNLLLWYDRADMEESLRGGVLAMLGIDKFLRTTVRKMSGGMKKRLSIGCAMAKRPQILLLDEPSAALDLVAKAAISSYLTEFKAAGGIVLLATHDIAELDICDRLYILSDGKLSEYIYGGDPASLAAKLAGGKDE